jgi:hypothetical protein
MPSIADAKNADSEMTVLERRQYTRFTVSEDVFVTFRPSFDRIGNVKDISKGGIGCEYLAFDKLDKVEQVEVDIFSKAHGFYISNVPCRVAYDTSDHSLFLLSGAEVRRCGLQFI